MNEQQEHLLSDEELASLYTSLMSDEHLELNTRSKKFIARLIDEKYPNVHQAYLTWKEQASRMQTHLPRARTMEISSVAMFFIIAIILIVGLLLIDTFFSVEDLTRLFK